MSYSKIGLAVACVGVGGLFYIASVKQVIRSLGERGMIITGGLVMASGFVGLTLIPSPIWVYPLLVVMGFGMYTMHNTLQTQATEMAPDARGTAVGLFAFVLMTGQGLGVALYGFIIDRHGYAPPYIAGAIIIALLSLWFQSTLKSRRYTPNR